MLVLRLLPLLAVILTVAAAVDAVVARDAVAQAGEAPDRRWHDKHQLAGIGPLQVHSTTRTVSYRLAMQVGIQHVVLCLWPHWPLEEPLAVHTTASAPKLRDCWRVSASGIDDLSLVPGNTTITPVLNGLVSDASSAYDVAVYPAATPGLTVDWSRRRGTEDPTTDHNLALGVQWHLGFACWRGNATADAFAHSTDCIGMLPLEFEQPLVWLNPGTILALSIGVVSVLAYVGVRLPLGRGDAAGASVHRPHRPGEEGVYFLRGSQRVEDLERLNSQTQLLVPDDIGLTSDDEAGDGEDEHWAGSGGGGSSEDAVELGTVQVSTQPDQGEHQRSQRTKQQQQDKQAAARRNAWRSRLRRIASVMLPRTQIPVLDASVMFIYVLATFSFVIYPMETVDRGRALGYLAALNSFLLAMPVTRDSPIARLFGISLTHSVKWHRWLGRLTMVTMTQHMITYLVRWAFNPAFRFGFEISRFRVVFGLVAWLTSGILIITSPGPIRDRCFRLFYLPHYMFVPFYLFASVHALGMLVASIAVLAVYGLPRLWRIAWPRDALSAAVLPGDVVRVRMRRPMRPRPLPGMYVFLNFPDLAAFDWHPFTLTSTDSDDFLEVMVRPIGQRWHALIAAASVAKPVRVRCGLPRGAPLPTDVLLAPVVCLVVADAGILPALALMRQRPADVAHRRRIHLVWVLGSEAERDTFRTDLALVQQRRTPVTTVAVYATATAATVELQDPDAVRAGWPDVLTELRTLAPDVTPESRCVVFASGPARLMSDVQRASSKQSWACCLAEYHW